MLVGEFDQVLAPGFVAADAEGRAVVLSLAGKDAIVVEVPGLDLEVPFADHRGLIAGLAHLDGQHLLAGHDAPGQVHGAVDVVVLAGQYAGPGRRADRIGAEGVAEEGALLGQAVQVWGRGELGEAPAIGGNGVGGVVVRHDEQHVGLAGGGLQAKGKDQPYEKSG